MRAKAGPPIWTENVAKHWADLDWRAGTWLGPIGHHWHEPRELPQRYAHFPYQRTQCMAAAVEAATRDMRLAIHSGYVFRDEEPARGILHWWNHDGNGVVDIALTEWPPPVGYLGLSGGDRR